MRENWKRRISADMICNPWRGFAQKIHITEDSGNGKGWNYDRVQRFWKNDLLRPFVGITIHQAVRIRQAFHLL